MGIEIWQLERPKGRKPRWAYRITDDVTYVFDSRSVSVHVLSPDAARWIARLIEGLRSRTQTLHWNGDLKDDCSAVWKKFHAHAEHLQGPRRGGIWYCSVGDVDGNRFFHTADYPDIQPRSGAAARWLCELMISSANAGFLQIYAA